MNLKKALIGKVGCFWGRRYLAVARHSIFAKDSPRLFNLYLLFILLPLHLAFFLGSGTLDYD